MISAATTGDERGVEGAYEAGQQYLGSASNEARSVLQYNYSVAQFNLANYDIAKPLVEDLIDKYYCRLGITAKDTFGVNPDEILSKVTAVDNPHVIYHHVGDCFLLLGYISNKRKKIALFEFTNAMKFYRMACAWRSYVHAGQEAVDNFLAKAELFDVALNCSESIVSVVNAFKLNELLVPVRAQYAVVLAWCGRVDDARAELARIESYATSDEGSAELQNQRNLIEEIAAAQVDE
ncbi:hypothetical protein [Amycolatopsis circi]|uniref:hypothetical protein n=1 Tax=Amycolatopsis circi TaxID=871959 RepID=UPI0013BE9D45|nr:hypothetical protein [Amycolatopsis circi]